jgi:hypothetical protein
VFFVQQLVERYLQQLNRFLLILCMHNITTIETKNTVQRIMKHFVAMLVDGLVRGTSINARFLKSIIVYSESRKSGSKRKE